MEAPTFTVHTSNLFDPTSAIQKEHLRRCQPRHRCHWAYVIQRDTIAAEIKHGDIDLRRKVAMSAFPHQPDQMRDESIVERTVRAVNHMRLSLLSGYTTYRDLGTEGLASHDASLRDAVNRGLPPGPRLFVATSCLATTGSYAIRTENYANGMMPPPICDSCDDVDGPPTTPSKPWLTTDASTSRLSPSSNPTPQPPSPSSIRRQKGGPCRRVRLAAGGDTGAFNHGQGAREMELLMDAGIPVHDVLEACMLGGWASCGKDACGYRFGWLKKGNRADIIALHTDPRVDKKALRKVSFVMKDAHVWKQNGVPVSFIDRVVEEVCSL
ncbi:amidohydrolase domain protein [Cordyceps militaris CM01]|uniref:Amidohydrolase domain protein n=1 Tax=Cordyceps militaris (strain CM01) TaxID=983644 RepID=G3JA39_CORMM|nr:amidohydrolase domain protein [Cordyceps militaris CM01]EGX95059.1 amidohydrolase domain protein [Cordyceps militaris CM01]